MLRTDYNTIFEQQLDKLNEAQREAVNAIEGPVMVIAGPGTGKTQILSARIGNILTITDTRPGNILCLTYTEAGAVAMRRRLTQMIGPDAYRVYIYTFHGFCNDVIQARPDYFGKTALEPISEIENIDLLRQLIDSLPMTHALKKLKGDLYSNVPRLNSLFQLMKQEGWTTEFIKEKVVEYINDLPNRDEYIYKVNRGERKKGDLKTDAIDEEKRKTDDLIAAAELLPVYQQMMLEKGRYDYGDMLSWVLKAFENDPYLLRNYQERFQYILVDEFQDTGGVQVNLLYKLLEYWGNTANIFVVGDDDQCIFEFQNARVRNIVEFYENFTPQIQAIVLKDNYRSSQPILDAAKKVIDNNNQRLINQLSIASLDKTLIAQGDGVKDIYTKPIVVQYPNAAQEAVDIANQLLELKAIGVSLKETAVIYYKHAQANLLMEVLEKSSIAYQVKRPINLLDDILVNNLLLLLQYVATEAERPHSAEGMLFRILHFEFFHLPVKDIAHIASYMAQMKAEDRRPWRDILSDVGVLATLELKEPARFVEVATFIDEWISGAHNLTLQMLFGKVINNSGLMKWLLTHEKKEFYLEVIRTFYDHIKQENARNTRISINAFLNTIEQMREHGISLPLDKSYTDIDAVQLLTCHGAKGLEFEYVFMIGCSNNQWNDTRGNSSAFKLPDTMTYAREESKTESMRRLFYVGMTRAKKQLAISYAMVDARGREDAPARFISEFIDTNDKGEPGIESRVMDNDTMIKYDIQLLSLPQSPVIETFDDVYLDKALEGFSMSASHLNKYLKCPLAFYYENVLRIPAAKTDSTAFGNAIHHALNRLFIRKNETPDKAFPPKEEMIKDFAWYMKREKDSFTDIQFNNRLALGDKVLSEYYDHYVPTWTKDAFTEYRISNVEVNGVPLKGFLDKIETKGREVHVVDYKTGDPYYARPKLNRVQEMEAGGEYWRQMVFYKILVDSQTTNDWQMNSGEINFIEKDSRKDTFYKHTYRFEPDEIAQVQKEITAVYKKIMRHEFNVGCGDQDCEWCTFVKENGLVIL